MSGIISDWVQDKSLIFNDGNPVMTALQADREYRTDDFSRCSGRKNIYKYLNFILLKIKNKIHLTAKVVSTEFAVSL